MKTKKTIPFLMLGIGLAICVEQSQACTRAVYLGPDHMIVTGRTMDWKEDPQSNIYMFPRGMQKRGAEYNKMDLQVRKRRDCRIRYRSM